MKKLLETIVIFAGSVMILLSFNSCDSCNNGKKNPNESIQSKASAKLRPVTLINPCNWQTSPSSCDTCQTGKTTQCYIDLNVQHKIPPNMVPDYLRRIEGVSFNFTPAEVQAKIAGIKCSYSFVMQILTDANGNRTMELSIIDFPTPILEARVFPVALIQHLLPANLMTVDSFEFSWLVTPPNCPEHASVLMVIKNPATGYDYYDVSVPPDFNMYEYNRKILSKYKLISVLKDTIFANYSRESKH